MILSYAKINLMLISGSREIVPFDSTLHGPDRLVVEGLLLVPTPYDDLPELRAGAQPRVLVQHGSSRPLVTEEALLYGTNDPLHAAGLLIKGIAYASSLGQGHGGYIGNRRYGVPMEVLASPPTKQALALRRESAPYVGYACLAAAQRFTAPSAVGEAFGGRASRGPEQILGMVGFTWDDIDRIVGGIANLIDPARHPVVRQQLRDNGLRPEAFQAAS